MSLDALFEAVFEAVEALDEEPLKLYVLLLDGGHYYVGTARNVERRVRQHFAGNGARWTMLHPPRHCVAVVEPTTPGALVDDYTENSVTKRLMHLYGVDRVRGGSYIEPILTEAQTAAVEFERDGCLACDTKAHSFLKCPRRSEHRAARRALAAELWCLNCLRRGHTDACCYRPRSRVRPITVQL